MLPSRFRADGVRHSLDIDNLQFQADMVAQGVEDDGTVAACAVVFDAHQRRSFLSQQAG